MRYLAAIGVALLIGGCNRDVPPESRGDAAIAAAERHAVADTDAALRDMAVPPREVVAVPVVAPPTVAPAADEGTN